MEPKSALPCSQEPDTGPYFEPDESSPQLPPYLPISILLQFSHLRFDLPSGLSPSGFSTKALYAFLISPVCASWSEYLILLHLSTLVIFGEAYMLWSSSLPSPLQHGI